MPSHKRCCVPGCKKAEGVHQVLHVFPNPEKDIQRFNMWFNAIGGDIVGKDNESIFKNYRVCNTHFELKYLCRYNRISKNAIPTLNMPGEQMKSLEASRGPSTSSHSGHSEQIAATANRGGKEAASSLEAPTTLGTAEAIGAGKREVEGAPLAPPTEGTGSTRKLELPPLAEVMVIETSRGVAANGAPAATQFSLEDTGGPWTVITRKVNDSTTGTTTIEPGKKRRTRPNATNRWKRKVRAEAALAASATNTGDKSFKSDNAKSTVRPNTQQQPRVPTTTDPHKDKANKRQRPEDTTTPSGAHKKARMSATPKSYATAAKSDLIAAITATNAGHLSREQAKEVQEVLNNKLWDLVQTRANNPPNFQGKPTYVSGSLQIWCANKDAIGWLKSTIDGYKLTSGTKVEVQKQARKLLRKISCAILIPGKAEPSQIVEALRYFNPWAGVERWLLHTAQRQSTGTFIVFSIPEDLILAILERGRQLRYLLGAVYIRFVERKGKFSDTPPQKPIDTSDADHKETEQQVDASTTEAKTTPQPSTSGINNPTSNVIGTAHDMTNVDMASVSDEADSLGDWAQEIEELDLGTGDDSDGVVPFAK